MDAIVFDRIGMPDDVLELRSVPVPNVGAGDVLVKLKAASVNPGDFAFVQSLYPEPKKPRLPGQIAGTGGGVGHVMEAGSGTSIKTGALVAFSYFAAWAEYAVVPEEWLIPLPSDFPIEVGAQVANAISAWDLVEQVSVRPEGWLAVTAGYSAVATMLFQFAARKNVKTLALVRRRRDDIDLKQLGATEIIDLSKVGDGLGEAVTRITGGRGPDGVIDSVGGPVTGDLIRSAAFGARIVLFGGMSPESFSIHNFDVALKDLKIDTYVYRYFFTPPGVARDADVTEILEASKNLRLQIGGRHTLPDYAAAIRETLQNASSGKRLFVMDAA